MSPPPLANFTFHQQLSLHKRSRGHKTYTDHKNYTFPTASVYKTMNGDSKLSTMRKALRHLSSNDDETTKNTCCTFTLTDPASLNTSEYCFPIRESKFKAVVQEEVNRLEAIETTRAGQGKRFLWPRWGNPRTRIETVFCLRETRHRVYKRHSTADVVYDCLDRRVFRPASVCDNCELDLDEKTYASMSVAELQRRRDEEVREAWRPFQLETTRQAPSKASMEEFERKMKRERDVAMSWYEAWKEKSRQTVGGKGDKETVKEDRGIGKEKRLPDRPKVVEKVRFDTNSPPAKRFKD